MLRTRQDVEVTSRLIRGQDGRPAGRAVPGHRPTCPLDSLSPWRLSGGGGIGLWLILGMMPGRSTMTGSGVRQAGAKTSLVAAVLL